MNEQATSPSASKESSKPDVDEPGAHPPAKRRLPLFLVLAALVLGGGYQLYRWRQPYEWSGTVQVRSIEVGSRVGGRIAKVLVKEGDTVKGGQTLVVLEVGDLDAQRRQAVGQLDQAKANLAKLERGARPEEIDEAKARATTAASQLEQARVGVRPEQISAARARLAAQQALVAKAELDQKRTAQLFASGAVAKAELDANELALQAAVAQRDALKGSLDELVNGSRREELAQASARAAEARANERLLQSGSRVEDIQAARGQLLTAQGRLEAIDVMLDELTVRVPKSVGEARVESLDLRPGDLLAPNAVAVSLVEPDQLYVRIYVPETQLGHIHPGQTVALTVDSFSGETFQGRVESIANVGEYSPRNLQTADERADQVFAARIGLGGAERLRAGMAAFIRVPK